MLLQMVALVVVLVKVVMALWVWKFLHRCRRRRRRRSRLSSAHGPRRLGCRRRQPRAGGGGRVDLDVDGGETFAEDSVVGLEMKVQHGAARYVLRRQLYTSETGG